MARFRLLLRSVIGDGTDEARMRNAGDVITLPAGMLPGQHLQPLDDEARALKAEEEERRSHAAPPGSVTARENAIEAMRGRALSETELCALYSTVKNPSFPENLK